MEIRVGFLLLRLGSAGCNSISSSLGEPHKGLRAVRWPALQNSEGLWDYCPVTGAEESKSKTWQRLVSGQGCPPGVRMAASLLCPHMAFPPGGLPAGRSVGRRESERRCLLVRTVVLWGQGPTDTHQPWSTWDLPVVRSGSDQKGVSTPASIRLSAAGEH